MLSASTKAVLVLSHPGFTTQTRGHANNINAVFGQRTLDNTQALKNRLNKAIQRYNLLQERLRKLDNGDLNTMETL